MNFSYLLNDLNNKQCDVVVSKYSNILVLAGAGSGKTRTLIHRIAWLQIVEKCSPNSIIAVTFTKKAAEEIRHRLKQTMKINKESNIWVDTFHGFAYRLLRKHYMHANLAYNFQIIDYEDQLRVIKNVIKEINLDEKHWSSKEAILFINKNKNNGLRPYHIRDNQNLIKNIWIKIYQVYQEYCDRLGMVDFSELLIRLYELWINNPYILQYYQNNLTNILVDEFQDTNNIQYLIIRLLAGKSSKTMIVGDDDQSIYGWRGAHVKNIQRFLKDFSNVKTIFLEQNYRSTSNILHAANGLIRHNNNRLVKRLWTNKCDGELISIYRASNDLDEANFVVNCIKNWKNKGGNLNECALLYRKNSQSRIFEEIFIGTDIPYVIYGGVRFFDRQEIKDAISYLRLIINHNDDLAFERIVNTPARGIGDRTFSKIKQISKNYKLTLWQSSYEFLKKNKSTNYTNNNLLNFLKLIESLKYEIFNLPLHIKTDIVIKKSGLWNMYKKEKGDIGQVRIDNLKELVNAARNFSLNNINKGINSLYDFLLYSTLESNENKFNNIKNDSVQLMTLHAAKGLEFMQVFIVGMEEGILPSQISLSKEHLLEEERRLAYVGLTRAIQKLTLTYAKIRYIYGKEVNCCPSRFIEELPNKYIEKLST